MAGASTVRKAGFVVKIRKADSDRLGAHWKTLGGPRRQVGYEETMGRHWGHHSKVTARGGLCC